jgi:hypothetical protein
MSPLQWLCVRSVCLVVALVSMLALFVWIEDTPLVHAKPWTGRYPATLAAANALGDESVLIDGETACCDEGGIAVFQMLWHRCDERAVPL